MVRRLVQKQEIRLPEQGLGQTDTGLLAAGKLLHRLAEILLAKAQSEGNAADAAFIVIAAQALETLHDLAVLSQCFLVGRYPDCLLHLPLALAQLDNILESPLEFLVEGTVAKISLLLNVAHSSTRIEGNRACICFLQAKQAAQKGRFARAIGAHKTKFLPPCDFKIHIMEEHFYAEGL